MSPMAIENPKVWVISLSERNCSGPIEAPHSFLAKLRLRGTKRARLSGLMSGFMVV
jgi:hypothetical protein